MRKLFALCLFAILIHLPTAYAVDGVREINQACVNFGCFPGDDPGFPVTINFIGSYRLTSNLLSAVDADISVIEININHVTLDLNGFRVSGLTFCSGSPISCANAGTGFGIDVQGNNVAIENGIISNIGSSCISSALGFTGNRFSDLSISECGSAGVVAATGRIDNVVITATGDVGINSFFGNVLVTNSSTLNTGSAGQIGGICSNSVFGEGDSGVGTVCVPLSPNSCPTGSSC